MYNTSFIKKILLVATVVLLYSCDKDFNAIGDDLIGDDHFALEATNYDVLAYNQEISPIQSNALAVNGLGIYDNPVFGTTTANYNAQLTLATDAPVIGDEPEIESAVLSIPYFSHATAVDPKGGNVYVLDSIFGPDNGKLKLSVYESGVQMRSTYFDNGGQYAQLYYTDQDSNSSTDEINFDRSKLGVRLNDSIAVSQNDAFFFDAAQKKDSTVDATTKKVTYTYKAPEMRLSLNKAFFQEKILNAPASKLSNSDFFQEYFRGLYFKVEKSGSNPSNMALMDFSKGTITIKYKAKTESTTDAETLKEEKSLIINLKGATASLLQDAKEATYSNAIKNPNNVGGDESLYLKGGQGSLSVIELFGKTDLIGYDANNVLTNAPNGVPDELDEIRYNVKVKHWMVNEANLVFYIDADKMKSVDKTEEVKRVYLYNLTNNTPLLDYVDGTSGFINNDTKQTRYIFGGIIERDASTGKGVSYKVRITNHIRSLIKDATVENVKLGLSVTESVDVSASNKLKLKNSVISEAPRGSVMSPLGTIIYGSKVSVPEAKRLRLKIYYTKPN